jgi:hypothetical protein
MHEIDYIREYDTEGRLLLDLIKNRSESLIMFLSVSRVSLSDMLVVFIENFNEKLIVRAELFRQRTV